MDAFGPANSAFASELTDARNGDASSLWRLCDQMRPRLQAIIARQLGWRVSAKLDPSDIVQEVMTSAIKQFRDFRGESREEWEGWIVQITRNEAKDALRYWHQDRRDISAEIEGEDELTKNLPDSSTPSGKVMRKEDEANILAAVELLPPDERKVVRMRHLEGKPLAEIASAIGRTPDGTAGLLKRAMARLRDTLSSSSDGGKHGSSK